MYQPNRAHDFLLDQKVDLHSDGTGLHMAFSVSLRRLLLLIEQHQALSYNFVSIQPRLADTDAPADAFHHKGVSA